MEQNPQLRAFSKCGGVLFGWRARCGSEGPAEEYLPIIHRPLRRALAIGPAARLTVFQADWPARGIAAHAVAPAATVITAGIYCWRALCGKILP
jgi:hypothetical protein